jgi:hypothetical protein
MAKIFERKNKTSITSQQRPGEGIGIPAKSNQHLETKPTEKEIVNVSLYFIIKTGSLIVRRNGVSTVLQATSGKDDSINNPADFRKRNVGPIPPGSYTVPKSAINDLGVLTTFKRFVFFQGDWGDWNVPIHPLAGTDIKGDDNKDRFGFYLHGGKLDGSAGCIDIGGGFSGNDQTDFLLNSLKEADQGEVHLTVIGDKGTNEKMWVPYIVQSGDVLWKIAQKHISNQAPSLGNPGVKRDIAHVANQIAIESELTNPGLLSIGQELKLPIMIPK